MYPSSSSNLNGKRPSSSISNSNMSESRKKARKDDESEASPVAEKEEVKAKPTRGSRFVTFSRVIGTVADLQFPIVRAQYAGA